MKLLLSFALITAPVTSYLMCTEKIENVKDQGGIKKHMHGNKHEYGKHHIDHRRDHGRRHHGHIARGEVQKHMSSMPENLNKEEQALYTEIRNLQNVMRKNMHALGQERRNIKNLMKSDARKQSQENINKICNEIKQNLEEHQPRIIEAIGQLS